MISQHFLDDSVRQLRKLKSQADKALAQTKDEHLFFTLDDGSNSIAIIMKHMAGNMRSRWTDLLTTDGEKPDRKRDTEFEISSGDDRERLLAAWEDGWSRVFGAIGALAGRPREDDFDPRGGPHGARGHQPAGGALRGAHRPDRAAREALCRRPLANLEHPAR